MLAHLQLKILQHLERVCEGRSRQACLPEDRRCSCWSAQRSLVCIAACCTLESNSQQALTLRTILAETASAVSKDTRANNVSACIGMSRTILEATVISWPRSQLSKTAGGARQSSLQRHIYKKHAVGTEGQTGRRCGFVEIGSCTVAFLCKRGVSEKPPDFFFFV